MLVALVLLVCPVISQGADDVVTDCSSDTQLRAKVSGIQFSGGGTLTFACGAPREIVLTGGVLQSIFTPTTIDGGGTITLNGNNATRIFDVSFLGGLTLQRIKLTNASSTSDGGAIFNAGGLALTNVEILNSTTTARGGALYVNFFGLATITNSRLAGNSADSGGAIFADSVTDLTAVTITDSVLQDNHATGSSAGSGWGGAVLLQSPADVSIEGGEIFDNDARAGGAIMSTLGQSTVTVHGTVIRNNRARNGSGGGIRLGFAEGFDSGSGSSAVLTDVTLSGNKAEGGVLDFPRGGGIYCDGCFLDLQRSTLAGNSATNRGGGLYFNGPVPASRLINDTIAGNVGGTFGGGGMYVNSGVLNLTNVTLAVNQAPAGAGGGIASMNSSVGLRNVLFAFNPGDNCHFVTPFGTPVEDSNLSSDGTCSFGPSRDNVNPSMSVITLADNGGPTQTFLFPATSPVIDAGTLNGCPPIDQRGAPRPAGGSCDVGAVESDSAVPMPTTTITTTTTIRTAATTTTTTLPSAVCGPACVTTDPCRPQMCVQTGCVAQDLAGLASASCACQRTPPAACANQAPPRKVLNAAAKGCNLLNAATAGPTGRRRVKKLTKAGQQFRTARRLVSKRPAKRVLTPECASALGADYDDAASRVGAVLRSGGG